MQHTLSLTSSQRPDNDILRYSDFCAKVCCCVVDFAYSRANPDSNFTTIENAFLLKRETA